MVVLDGAASADEWNSDEDAPVQGILGVTHLPMMARRDYLANENDTHWTNHAIARLEGYAAIVGPERTPRSLRTRNGLDMVTGLIRDACGKVTLDDLRVATTHNRVWSAVLWRNDVCEACADDPVLASAVQILREWDSSEHVASRGAILWRRFYEHFVGADPTPSVVFFTDQFDPADPLDTPSRINRHAGIGVVEALRRAVADLDGLPLDVSVGEVQYFTRAGKRHPIPGGPDETGQYNLIDAKDGFVPGRGYPNVTYGTGYQLWVAFTADGPVAESILAYSQSEDPSSPYHSDQTEMCSRGETKQVRFHPTDVLSNAVKRVVLGNGRTVLSEMPSTSR
ncbi:penicillin acylase family protein [Rhodococcus sp. ACPA1]|uniref:penicillin acylase family protein n=1 Tax=Rhodococcus sp. ACPA1 TaxID=2028572 RepID=UPI00211BFEF7|nr:penicillin acylase family protein [Rhodococcus sp. ACPA1]